MCDNTSNVKRNKLKSTMQQKSTQTLSFLQMINFSPCLFILYIGLHESLIFNSLFRFNLYLLSYLSCIWQLYVSLFFFHFVSVFLFLVLVTVAVPAFSEHSNKILLIFTLTYLFSFLFSNPKLTFEYCWDRASFQGSYAGISAEQLKKGTQFRNSLK